VLLFSQLSYGVYDRAQHLAPKLNGGG